MATLVWKGYTWDLRNGGTGSPGYASWASANVTGPDVNGYITLQITNPSGSLPVGAELVNQTSLGYGTYTSVVQTGDMTAAHKNIVWGGMFPINNATPYIEFDAGETSKWDQDFGGVSMVDHNMWYGNVSSPDNTGSGDEQATSTDTIVTNRLIWLPGDVTFDTFAGTGTSGTLLFHSHYTTNVPAPNGEQVDFNLWTYASSNATKVLTNATNYSVVVRDFTFVPASSAKFTIKDHVEFIGTGQANGVHMNNVANGDTLIAIISVNNATPVQSVTDTGGNVYTRAGQFAGTAIGVELWYCLSATNVNAATVLTITPATSADKWAAEWLAVSGIGAINSFDQKAGTSGNGTSMNTGNSPVTLKPNELVFGVFAQANNRAWTTGTGFTQISNFSNGTVAGFMSEYKIVSATSQYNATAAIDIGSNWAGGVFTFADSAVASSSVAVSVSDSVTTSDVPSVAVAAAGGGPSVTVVQSKAAGSGGNYVQSLGATFGANTTSGNSIVVFVSTSNASGTAISTVTDSQGNTYTRQTGIAGTDSCSLEVWLAQNITGGTLPTITATTAASAFNLICLEAYEVNGLIASAFDKSAATAATSYTTSNSSGNTAALAQSNEIVFAGISSNLSGVSYSTPSTYTGTILYTDSASFLNLATTYKTVSTTTAVNVTWASTQFIQAIAGVYTFKVFTQSPTVSVSDSVTVTDVIAFKTIPINVSETVTTSEFVQFPGSFRTINVSDSTSLSDSAGLFAPNSVLFFSTCDTLADFNDGPQQDIIAYEGAGQSVTINQGQLKMVLTNSASDQIGVRRNVGTANAARIKFDYILDTNASLNADHTICQLWTANYLATLMQMRIEPVPGTNQYRYKLVDPNKSYISVIATKRLNKGQTYSIELRVTPTQFALFIDGHYQAVWKYSYAPNPSQLIGVAHFGKFFTTGMSGIQYFDNVLIDFAIPVSPAVGRSAEITAAYAGWKARYMRSDGAVVRPYAREPWDSAPLTQSSEGSNSFGQGWSDVVSEGVSYGMLLAVIMNDQTAFNLIETFCYTILCRRNHPSDNNIRTNGGNLMGWHWADDINSANLSQDMIDWNWASDADNDRAQALMWAHATWGSSGTINYQQRAKDLLADIRTKDALLDLSNGYYYQQNDQFNSSPIVMNISYLTPYMFRMAKTYDTGNDAFWNNLIEGSYDTLLKNTSNGSPAVYFSTTSGLPTEWHKYDVNSHTQSTGGYGGSDANNNHFGYNAFRTIWRFWMDYLLYGDVRARTWLAGNLATFYNNQYSTQLDSDGNHTIWAEYNHDGTVYNNAPYEGSIFMRMAWIAMQYTFPTQAADLYTKKLKNGFHNDWAVGGFYAAGGNGVGNQGYFGDSWGLFAEMGLNGNITNPTPGGKIFLSANETVNTLDVSSQVIPGAGTPAFATVDGTTISEFVTLTITKLFISVSDTVTTTESTTQGISNIPTLTVNKFDSVTCSESKTIGIFNIQPDKVDLGQASGRLRILDF